MKILASLLFFYIMALTTLPSVRAVKVVFIGNCPAASHQNTTGTNDPLGCQKAKIIMGLSFSPIQHISEFVPYDRGSAPSFVTVKKPRLYFRKVLIDQYHNSIWQPPKIIS